MKKLTHEINHKKDLNRQIFMLKNLQKSTKHNLKFNSKEEKEIGHFLESFGKS